MKHTICKYILNVRYLLWGVAAFAISGELSAQSPTHVPRKSQDPVGLFDSIENIVFYIVLPIVIIVLYLLWRKRRKSEQKEEENHKMEGKQ